MLKFPADRRGISLPFNRACGPQINTVSDQQFIFIVIHTGKFSEGNKSLCLCYKPYPDR